MDDQSRNIILKLLHRLSDHHRKDLHFSIGNIVPRRVRDDHSYDGTLNLIDYLFDLQKITERDFTFLIHQLVKIQCHDAAELLREHMGLTQTKEQNQSTKLPTIDELLKELEEDKMPVKLPPLNQESESNNTNTVIAGNNANINALTDIAGDQKTLSSQSKGKRLGNLPLVIQKCLILFALLSTIGLGVLISVFIVISIRIDRLTNELIMKNKNILEEQLKNNQSIRTIQQLTNQLEQLRKKTSFGKTCDEVWVQAKDGEIPSNAIVGGQEGGRPVYVVRLLMQDGSIIPGKLVETNREAEFAYHGVPRSSLYQVLTNSDPKWQFKWVTTSGATVPECAFLAGREGNERLYVGRVHHTSGSLLLGKHIVPYGGLFFPYGGREQRLEENFEVLCVS